MGHKADARLTERVKREIDEREPAVTFNGLVDILDCDERDILIAIEELKVRGELKEDTIFWRGGSQSMSPYPASFSKSSTS